MEQELLQQIGKNIKETRKEYFGMSQRELSRRTGIRQALISRIERGMVDIRITDLVKIAQVTSFPLSMLVGDYD